MIIDMYIYIMKKGDWFLKNIVYIRFILIYDSFIYNKNVILKLFWWIYNINIFFG